MSKRRKEPTIQDLQKQIKDSFKRWKHLHKKGGVDPSWPDGTNMNLVRNHVFYDQDKLRELCKAQKVRPCPIEAKMKPPRRVSEYYCAPKSKSGPCKERRRLRRKLKS
jgi:hypothetical protein